MRSFSLGYYTLLTTSKPSTLFNSDLAVAISTKNITFFNFGLDAFNRVTPREHVSNVHVFRTAISMMELQNTGIRFPALLARMSKKVLVNVFFSGCTGRFCSFLYLLQMPFMGITLIIVFVKFIHTFFTGFIPNTETLPSPAKFFLIFPFTTVVAFLLCHDFLRKLYLSYTS